MSPLLTWAGSMQAGQMFAFAPDMSSAAGAATAFVNLADSNPLIDVRAEAEGQPATDIQGAIRFRDVHFRYLARPHVPVLRGLDLDIAPGQFIALCGPSGCGKSTITALIQRFYDVLSGSVEIDGRDIQSYNLRSLRSRIALVSQEPTLYQGTLRDNIALGDAAREVSQDEIEQAAREANIHDFIVGLPDGYDTLAGAKGTQLSGASHQLARSEAVLIASQAGRSSASPSLAQSSAAPRSCCALRWASMADPDRPISLDEATSALDSESERVVQKALDAAAVGRTTIAVAHRYAVLVLAFRRRAHRPHRLSTIQHADQIMYIQAGKVVERGNWAQLMAAKGPFYELAMQQALSKTK